MTKMKPDNKTDLDLLAQACARGEMPEGADGACFDAGGRYYWTFVGESDMTGDIFHPRQEIIGHYHKLSGKPAWDSHSFNTIAQGGNGCWYGHPETNIGALPATTARTKWEYIKDGKNLGNYRDTLEERDMEDLETRLQSVRKLDKPKVEKPKWNGPSDGVPPLSMELDGVKCMSSAKGIGEWWGKPYWRVVGHHINGKTFFVEAIKSGVTQQFTIDTDKPQFRPIKTERERVVEKIAGVVDEYNEEIFDIQDCAEAIYYQVIEPMNREGE